MGQCTVYAADESQMLRRKPGELVGRWKLVHFLGKGGNAEVWRASDGRAEVALKILNQRRAESEPYQRFRQEIETLRQIGDHANIMPLLDAHLPEAPSKTRPAWLAMPIAVPLAEALSRSGLREVITAVAGMSEVLAALHEYRHVHHRDIKPSNLYLHEGRPTISDFGLADLPESDDLTVTGQPLGPKFFLAYEMIDDPKNADPGPADVFSLAKTLWVLCTDQRWPPQGEQQASNSVYSIGRMRPHPLAHHLDELIERCTRHEPLLRPSMRQLSEDLRAWLSLDNVTPQQSIDLSATWNRLRKTAEPRLRQVDEEAAQQRCFQSAVRRLQELLEPLHAEIRQEYPAAEFNQLPKIVESMFHESLRHEITNEDIRATILSGPGLDPVKLAIGVAIRTRVSGELEFGGIFFLGRMKTLDHKSSWESGLKRAACGSIAVERGLLDLATELRSQFPSWLEEFTDALLSEKD